MLSSIAGKCDRTCVVNFIKDRDSELYNFLTGNEQSRYGRFYKITTTQPDEKLEKILAEVSQEDNDNAFPALFHAVILMEIKKPAEALRVYQEALKRKSYVNYGPLIRKKLKQLTVHDDQLFAQAILISELEPDMIGPYSYDHFIGLNNELRLKLGRILVRAPLKDEGKNAFLNWSPADYIYGRDIIEELDPMALTTFNDIESTMEREEEDFPQYYNFDCHEKDFFIYHKLEKERLLGNE